MTASIRHLSELGVIAVNSVGVPVACCISCLPSEVHLLLILRWGENSLGLAYLHLKSPLLA